MAEAVMKGGMATSETWAPSRRMRSAAVAERERVERELRRLDVRREELAQELAVMTTAADELRGHLRVLNRFAYDQEGHHARPPLRVIESVVPDGPQAKELLKGSRIRDAAVRVLAGTDQAHTPVHYRTWYELLEGHGFTPGGKDPLATFLTQLNRSPVVHRAGRPGMYALDYSYPARARQRLEELRLALRRAHERPANADVEVIASTRERRDALASEIRATERGLEEALRSLGEDST